ncbi:MFS general substrate transporter, partial [Cystobasidium minutum MCA 4210]|uniref:MFS general substrate transporter n=1 Tax=Cystobasidium minutum MCA 4210 TaxID=1397322 RepID=UPI0034CF1714
MSTNPKKPKMQSLKPAPSRPQVPPSHDSGHPDLAYPSLTTAISRPTGEYRETAETGVVSGQELVRQLTQVQPSAARVPTRISASDAERLEKLQLVTFKTEDPEDPRQWSNAFKWYVTAVVAIAVVQVAFASAIVTGDFAGMEDHFHVSRTVIALTVSLMVAGFGVGPLLWSPISELFGRRWCWLIPMTLYTIFNIPCALAPNIGALLSCRFLCGFFAAAPLTLAGGAISDVWDTDE